MEGHSLCFVGRLSPYEFMILDNKKEVVQRGGQAEDQ